MSEGGRGEIGAGVGVAGGRQGLDGDRVEGGVEGVEEGVWLHGFERNEGVFVPRWTRLEDLREAEWRGAWRGLGADPVHALFKYFFQSQNSRIFWQRAN